MDLADIYHSLSLKIDFFCVWLKDNTYYLNFFWRTLQIPKFTRLYLNRRKTERNYFQNRYRQYWFGEFHNFAISIVNLRSIALDMSANIILYVVKLCTYKRRLRITQISSSWDTTKIFVEKQATTISFMEIWKKYFELCPKDILKLIKTLNRIYCITISYKQF